MENKAPKKTLEETLETVVSESNNPKFRYEISENMKKISKMQKFLIDISQLSTEMADELIALELSYSDRISPENMRTIRKMQTQLKGVNELLRNATLEDGTPVHLSYRLDTILDSLEDLKRTYLKKRKS
jgi:hypothetical protein